MPPNGAALIDPDAGRVLFGNYAADWIEERPGLRPKTTELYRYLLRRHLSPTFYAGSLAEIREPHVRRWRKDLLDAGVSAVTVAKAYRLLKAVFNTAVDDGLIRRNPCRIKGAGQEKSAERPVLTVAQVYALADAADERYRALVLLAAFSSLRWGELAALRRSDIDIQARSVRVTRQLNERDGGGFAFGPPKSEAGQRIVAIHELITPDLAAHVMTYARPGDEGLVFTSPGGGPLRQFVRDGRRAAPNGHSSRPAVPHATSRCRRSGRCPAPRARWLVRVRTGWRHPSRGPRRLAARGGR